MSKWNNTKERQAFYDSRRWRKVRRIALGRDKHLCRMCKRKGIVNIGNEVDHILPLDTHPEKALDVDNLQTLCHDCHNRKTASDKRGFKDVCIHGQLDGANVCKLCLDAEPE